jgi:predicted HTH transcriptional regulator
MTGADCGSAALPRPRRSPTKAARALDNIDGVNPIPDLNALPESTTAPEFWKLFGKIEHERLDFKVKVGNDLQDTIAAMAMTAGGAILLGVADNRTLIGCPETQEVVDGIGNGANACSAPVPVERRGIDVDGVKLTVVVVPAVQDRIVTTSSGRLLRRSGSFSIPLRGEEVTQFVLSRLPEHVTPEQLAEAIEAAKQHATNEAITWSLIN